MPRWRSCTVFAVGGVLPCKQGELHLTTALKDFGALAGVGNPAFKELPLQAKTRIGLPTAARILSQMTDQQSTVTEIEDAYLWTIQRCPICWRRKGAEKPVCHFSTGLLHGLLTWVSGGLDFRIDESKCCAVGGEVCEFVIQKIPIS